MSTNERPGVYTSYEVSNVLYSGVPSGVAGIAATATTGTDGELCTITSYAAALTKFGSESAMSELIRILIKNGVAQIKAVPIVLTESKTAAETADYEAAFDKLAKEENVKIILCDSADAAVHSAMKNSILTASEKNASKIGVVESTGTMENIITAAKAVNSERMVMVAPRALGAEGDEAITGSLAAAVAGAILTEADPAVPLNGAELFGFTGVSQEFTDGDITSLVQGGVTPVECVGGTVSVVRGITTKTTTNGEADYTWRELTTILIVDDVIPTIRDALRSSFSRTKNTAQTRDAIRTRVIVELEKKIAAEIIDSYGNVSVTQDSSDPTVCIVTFEFTVAHGLNQIRLTAYITV